MKKTITYFINTRNGEKFATVRKAADEQGNDLGKVILIREDGSDKTVAMSAFKRYFKKVVEEIEVEEPKAETKAETKHQKVAADQLSNAYDWIVGGYMNGVQDGDLEEMPPVEDLFTEVLAEATAHLYGKGMCSQKPAPAAMQFAGRKFVRETLADLFKADGYEVPAELLKVPEKHKAVGPRKNIKGDPENVGDDEVVMRAFTGMVIGVFQIVDQSKDHIIVELANGIQMEFNRHTGIQADAANPRFANRIEI